jgi:hypothetical protein
MRDGVRGLTLFVERFCEQSSQITNGFIPAVLSGPRLTGVGWKSGEYARSSLTYNSVGGPSPKSIARRFLKISACEYSDNHAPV